MATQPWAADLDRLQRELTRTFERALADAQTAANRNQSRGNDNTDVTRRVDAMERRLQTTIDETNRTFTSAHTADGRMGTRVDQMERRLQTTIDQINRTVTSAHTEDGRLATRIDQLDRRLAELARTVERSARP